MAVVVPACFPVVILAGCAQINCQRAGEAVAQDAVRAGATLAVNFTIRRVTCKPNRPGLRFLLRRAVRGPGRRSDVPAPLRTRRRGIAPMRNGLGLGVAVFTRGRADGVAPVWPPTVVLDHAAAA